MILADNIRYLRRRKNWTQDYLADLLGYKSYTTIQKWEMGVSEPPLKTLTELARLFAMDIDDLTSTPIENGGIRKTAPKVIKIPVLGTVRAGIPTEAIEDILDWEEISADLAKCGEFFALQIKGDSMEPRICEGDVVIVRRQPDAENGEIVIAQVNGDESCCKKLIKKLDSIILQSFNPSYSPLMYSQKEIKSLPVTIIGKVIELRAKF